MSIEPKFISCFGWIIKEIPLIELRYEQNQNNLKLLFNFQENFMKIFIFLNIFTFHLPFSCKQNIQTYISTSQKSKNTSIYSLVKMSQFFRIANKSTWHSYSLYGKFYKGKYSTSTCTELYMTVNLSHPSITYISLIRNSRVF